ncbi:MAG: helix-turn-helix domain-containing protein [Burkholderiales bacterium]|nr:helix-turn-helix domain-containing protein [Burkholderiales bacterium]
MFIRIGFEVRLVAARFGVSVTTARKWVGRYLAQGQSGLLDHSSRPLKSPSAGDCRDHGACNC